MGTDSLGCRSMRGFRERDIPQRRSRCSPYIKRLGATTVHLLLSQSSGTTGKGLARVSLCHSESVQLDENLSEPSLRLDAKTEFKAFVEAAHTWACVWWWNRFSHGGEGLGLGEGASGMDCIGSRIGQVRDPQNQDESRYGSPLFTPDDSPYPSGRPRKPNDNLIAPIRLPSCFTASPPEECTRKTAGSHGLLPTDAGEDPGAFADCRRMTTSPPGATSTISRLTWHPISIIWGYNTIRMYTIVSRSCST